MTGAFIYLTVCSFRNAIRARAARLREPRYAIGLVFGLGYLLLAFGRSLRRLSHRTVTNVPGPIGTFLADNQQGLEVIGAVTLVGLGAIAWLFAGGARPALAFTRSEVQFLFPAPVTRRELIHYKILRSQGGAALSSLIVTLLLHAGNLAAAWMSFLGLWVVMVIVNLHLTGVALRRQSLAEHGRSGVRQQLVPIVVIAGALAVIAAAVVSDWRVLTSLGHPGEILREIARVGNGGALRILLSPLVAVIRLPLASTPGELLTALPMALVVLAANYLWVVRADAAFEEASAAFAERQAERRETATGAASATVARVRAEPFRLQPLGRPEVALLWKNLVMIGRYANGPFLVRLALAFIVSGFLVSRRSQGLAAATATICLFGAALTTMFGAQWVRSDLRRDLSHLATLRTWPVSGAAIVRGEVLAPTALLTAIVWLFVAVALACGAGAAPGATPLALHRLSLAIGAMLLAPGVVLTQVVICNGVAAAFPAWSANIASGARGLDVFGQRMLTSGGLLAASALALVPALAVATIVGFGIRAITGIVPVIVPAAVATGVLVIENALAIEAIGRVLDRADVATLPPAP